MPSHTPPSFIRHPLSTAIQAAITATALSLPLWAQAEPPAGTKLGPLWVGGYSDQGGDANGNNLVLQGTPLPGATNAIAGGFSHVCSGNTNGCPEGEAAKGNANNNTLTLNAGSYSGIQEVWGGSVADGTGSANGNTLVLDGMSNSTQIQAFGGFAGNFYSEAGSASDNKVIMHSGEAGSIIGGYGDAGSTGNTIEIHGGTVNFDVTGGSSMWGGNATGNSVLIEGDSQINGGVVSGFSGKGSANDNTVLIKGGTINGVIAGGGVYWNSEKGSATRNTVTIEGKAANLDQASLFGGSINLGEGIVVPAATYVPAAKNDLFTGNTLNLVDVNGLTVQEVGNFEFLNFTLPENTQSGDTILTVTGTADIQGSTIGVRVLGNEPVLEVGDTVSLIEAGELKADSTIKTRRLQGSTIEYVFDTQQHGDTLTSTVTRRGATDSAKSLSEGFVAGAAALTAAADFASSQGTAAAVGAVAGAGGSAGGQSFGTTGGGSIRNNTGSHVDVRSFNLVAGLAKGLKQDNGELTVGGFFEYGHGNYSSFNNFATGTVRGDGKTRSYGLGVLAHYALDSGLYGEVSLRAGRAEQDYNSNALGSYDSKTHYVGSHIGAGKVWALSDSLGLDTYAHYVWQRQSGDTVKLSTGETLAFDAVTSQRVRLGARLTKGLNDTVSAYVGAGYENELDGKARATTNGVPIDSPSMKGDSGLVELGLNVRPLKNKALTLGVGVQGYFGQKEGVTGTLQVGYKF
ncbi:MAG: autotransporter outer membrane beta-barrel domain-containing protein [Comamonas sp.]|nr:autotransporter outer membrane beta-barrel domain-containing protein [Comamonas sp.]